MDSIFLRIAVSVEGSKDILERGCCGIKLQKCVPGCGGIPLYVNPWKYGASPQQEYLLPTPYLYFPLQSMQRSTVP